MEMDESFRASEDFSAPLYFYLFLKLFFCFTKVSDNPKYQPEDAMNFYLRNQETPENCKRETLHLPA